MVSTERKGLKDQQRDREGQLAEAEWELWGFVWPGMWETGSEGKGREWGGSHVVEGELTSLPSMLLLEGADHNVILHLCWFECPMLVMSLNTKQMAAWDARNCLNLFCIASRHHLHVSTAAAEKLKFETTPLPWFLRKHQLWQVWTPAAIDFFPEQVQLPSKSFSPREEAQAKGANGGKVREDKIGWNFCNGKMLCKKWDVRKKERNSVQDEVCIWESSTADNLSFGQYVW